VMVITNKPIEDLMREMYARFGLAYYYSEVLHRVLCIILAMSNLPRKDMITRRRVEEHLVNAFSMTLGQVITELAGRIPAEYSTRLEEVLEKRNFLDHHFWFDRAQLMFRAENIQQLIEELDGYAAIFSRLDEETTAWSHKRQNELGITDDILQASIALILSGKGMEPLPDKDAVKKRTKKIKKKQRLVRVWEFDLPDGGKPLVFEMQDGTLWQLCDVGLGWTRFENTEPHWVEHPAVKPYLPVDITPRPKDAKPWEYEFSLKAGAVLWVRPGKRPKTFQWGIRRNHRGTEQSTGAYPSNVADGLTRIAQE
jgi:hypothetical protein